jgi:hypothetical protein
MCYIVIMILAMWVVTNLSLKVTFVANEYNIEYLNDT